MTALHTPKVILSGVGPASGSHGVEGPARLPTYRHHCPLSNPDSDAAGPPELEVAI
jgi:hypothetical protein